jgi:hypothetical protein
MPRRNSKARPVHKGPSGAAWLEALAYLRGVSAAEIKGHRTGRHSNARRRVALRIRNAGESRRRAA